MSIAEFARLIKCHPTTVLHWRRAGALLLDAAGLIDPCESLCRLLDRPPSYRGALTISRAQLLEAERELVQQVLALSLEMKARPVSAHRAEARRRRRKAVALASVP